MQEAKKMDTEPRNSVKQYVKGQKLKVPREVRKYLEQIIAQREQYESEAFRRIGELFGLSGKDIGEQQKWLFALDHENNVAYSFNKDDEERAREKEIDKDLVLEPIAKLEIAKQAHVTVINILTMTMRDIDYYWWVFHPADMEVEITGVRPPKDPTAQFDLSDVSNQGSVQ